MNNPEWVALVSSGTVQLFSKEEDFSSTTIQRSSDDHSREEPVSDHSSWKELKKATLNEDYIEEDILLTSNGEVGVSSSTASRFNYDDMKTYGCKPLKDESGIVNCKECSKKVLPHGFINHSVNCEKIKVNASETTQNVDVSTEVPVNDVTINKNTKNPTSETYSSNKKRKKSVASEVEVTEQSLNTKTNSPASAKIPPEKKQKVKKEKEKKKTTGRNKGPIDLDRQCGVVAPPNNTPCARSLTCKSHSMALKRGVMGRSQSYDVLLAAYQKKSIGRPQNNGVQNNKQDNAKKDGKAVVPDKDEGVLVDSEEEVDAVMKAIINDMLPEGIA